MGAGFEGDVERRTASKFPSLAQRDYLRVVLTGGLRVALPDDPAVSCDDCPNRRVRACAPDRRARQLQRMPHENVCGLAHRTGICNRGYTSAVPSSASIGSW